MTHPVHITLAALSAKVSEAAQYAAAALNAADRGNQAEALGTLMPAEQLLKDALALYTAAVILHLESR
jgi:hypothetical protein